MTNMKRNISQVKRLMPLSKLVNTRWPTSFSLSSQICLTPCFQHKSGRRPADDVATHETDVLQTPGCL